jgi:hypothetical protein
MRPHRQPSAIPDAQSYFRVMPCKRLQQGCSSRSSAQHWLNHLPQREAEARDPVMFRYSAAVAIGKAAIDV